MLDTISRKLKARQVIWICRDHDDVVVLSEVDDPDGPVETSKQQRSSLWQTRFSQSSNSRRAQSGQYVTGSGGSSQVK